jgi:myo-inositol 2-dehydrogenase/D-chiro-inositol 1-dehydrogenase
MARYFIPRIVEVSAVGANSFCDYIAEENDFDSVTVTMKGANNEIVTIINSRRANYGYDQRLEAFGSEGMFIASNVSPTTVQHYNSNHAEQHDPYIDNFLELYAVAYRRELALFVEGVRTGQQLTPTFDDGRAALILADAAHESARTGKSVKVSV